MNPIKRVTWDRVADKCCVMCGNPLISPKDATIHMCKTCEGKTIEAAKKQIKNRDNRIGNVGRRKLKISLVGPVK